MRPQDMKWMQVLVMIRHAESLYNHNKKLKNENKVYKKFLAAYEKDPFSAETKLMAQLVCEELKLYLTLSDAETPLLDEDCAYTAQVARCLQIETEVPDVLFVSPYVRTQQTLIILQKYWPALRKVKVVVDERIREREFGDVVLYPDMRVFLALNPDQLRIYQKSDYWYRPSRGENIPDVRLRLRSFNDMLIREYSGKKVLLVTHHLTILAMRSLLDRFGEEEFHRLDQKEKPINSGVTIYKGDPTLSTKGKLVLNVYNKKYQ